MSFVSRLQRDADWLYHQRVQSSKRRSIVGWIMVMQEGFWEERNQEHACNMTNMRQGTMVGFPPSWQSSPDFFFKKQIGAQGVLIRAEYTWYFKKFCADNLNSEQRNVWILRSENIIHIEQFCMFVLWIGLQCCFSAHGVAPPSRKSWVGSRVVGIFQFRKDAALVSEFCEILKLFLLISRNLRNLVRLLRFEQGALIETYSWKVHPKVISPRSSTPTPSIMQDIDNYHPLAIPQWPLLYAQRK